MSSPWYYSKVFVYIVLALMGPLGFPLLWMSPRFSKRERWVWTAVIVAGTALLIALSSQVSQMLGTQMELIQQLSP
ncbi:MAG: hypothetical protein HYS56_00200 [Candidatus Omnitrophica bacterium]|nr:hypothetical protein [Candidatus Omnitrophota bacterium]